MPTMKHGDWEKFGKQYWNHHKKTFGVKLEIAAAMQRRPVPLWASVAKGGTHDLTIARRPGGVFSRLRDGERGLGDPGYLGEPSKVYAPPRRNMDAYVAELDKAELNLQRRVEMLNRHLKQFKVLGTIYRKGAVRAFEDLQVIAIVVAKLVYIDMMLNQEQSGEIHTTGPIPDRVAAPVLHQHVTGAGARARLSSKLAAEIRSAPISGTRRERGNSSVSLQDRAILASIKRQRKV